jgi:hypothetical protein
MDIVKNKKILIEVAAQHPLVNGETPGHEFVARLEKAVALYNKLVRHQNTVKLYVPGSRHRIMVDGKWVDDKISLSEAGATWLAAHGIPESDIYAVKKNKHYAPKGVYNSVEECEVASAIYVYEGFDYLLSICTLQQRGRIQAAYEFFGVPEAKLTSVRVRNSFHNREESEEKRRHFLQDPIRVYKEMEVASRRERVPADGKIY